MGVVLERLKLVCIRWWKLQWPSVSAFSWEVVIQRSSHSNHGHRASTHLGKVADEAGENVQGWMDGISSSHYEPNYEPFTAVLGSVYN